MDLAGANRQALQRSRTIKLICHPGPEGDDDNLDQLRRCLEVAGRGGCVLASFDDLQDG